jgi:DNA-binding GntR family transcriptional regulator
MTSRSSLPAFLRVAADLRRQIETGTLAPGGQLPSMSQIRDLYGVSNTVVRDALNELRRDGLIVGQQGKGVFVRSDSEPAIASDVPTTVADLRRRVDQLSSDLTTAMSTEVADLKRQIGVLQAQLIELYARTGQPFPADEATASAPGRSRKAAAS